MSVLRTSCINQTFFRTRISFAEKKKVLKTDTLFTYFLETDRQLFKFNSFKKISNNSVNSEKLKSFLARIRNLNKWERFILDRRVAAVKDVSNALKAVLRDWLKPWTWQQDDASQRKNGWLKPSLAFGKNDCSCAASTGWSKKKIGWKPELSHATILKFSLIINMLCS